ncbi:alpha/beta hydrolase, partial [Pseudoalteromonas sp. S1612]
MSIVWVRRIQQTAIAEFIYAHGAGAVSDSEFMQ